MITAIVLFMPLTVLVLLAELKLLQAAAHDPMQGWFAVHLYLPLMRAAVIMVFIFVAYPDIFGLDAAPSLGTLLDAGRYRFDQLINLLLAVSLLLPLLPWAHRVTDVTLALQGTCIAAVMASWIAASTGQPIVLIPGVGVVARIVGILVVAGIATQMVARTVFKKSEYRQLATETGRLLAQLPAVVVYARALGAQLPL